MSLGYSLAAAWHVVISVHPQRVIAPEAVLPSPFNKLSVGFVGVVRRRLTELKRKELDVLQSLVAVQSREVMTDWYRHVFILDRPVVLIEAIPPFTLSFAHVVHCTTCAFDGIDQIVGFAAYLPPGSIFASVEFAPDVTTGVNDGTVGAGEPVGTSLGSRGPAM